MEIFIVKWYLVIIVIMDLPVYSLMSLLTSSMVLPGHTSHWNPAVD